METVHEIQLGNATYHVKSILPERQMIREILLRVALDESVKLTLSPLCGIISMHNAADKPC
jgi:hypothetical protein